MVTNLGMIYLEDKQFPTATNLFMIYVENKTVSHGSQPGYNLCGKQSPTVTNLGVICAGDEQQA